MAQRFTRANLTSRAHRRRRIRARVRGTPERPRLAVFRSLQHVAAQLIDDVTGHTLIAASDRDVSTRGHRSRSDWPGKVAIAREVGKIVAARAKERGVMRAVFDRGGCAYHGRVKAVAEGAREGGLEF